MSNHQIERHRPVPVIAALQLPAFSDGQNRSMAWYEDFLLSNARVFVEAGIKEIKLQDETREVGVASPLTVARMASLGRTFRSEYPDVQLGIIVQAHDAIAPLAIADAAGAHFVRLKIFVGAAVNAEGVRSALNVAATRYRNSLHRPDIRIYADAHDRTCQPLAPVADETAALWAQSMGADAVVITGSSFDDTLSRIAAARDTGLNRPVLIGGGVNAENVGAALAVADAVIVSTSMLRDGAEHDDFNLWDKVKVRRLVEAAAPAVENRKKQPS